MKPINKLQLYSQSTKKIAYVFYFAIAGLIIFFIIQYFMNSGETLTGENNLPDGNIPAVTPGATSTPIAAVNRELKSYSINSSDVTVFAPSEYIPDPASVKSQSLVSLHNPNTGGRVLVRVLNTNPDISAESYARANVYIYGKEVQNARSFRKSVFSGFRYVVVSENRSVLYAVAFIKTFEMIHVLQVSSPVTDQTIGEVQKKIATDLDQVLSVYNLTTYEEREFTDNGYSSY
ncbi:MAG: hypothetical protein M3Q44_03080 [bacterium]|nr:hypothetical protein [bacterium]